MCALPLPCAEDGHGGPINKLAAERADDAPMAASLAYEPRLSAYAKKKMKRDWRNNR